MDLFNQLDAVIQKNLSALKKPGVMTVRPGYKITGGWITKQPAIVVTVEHKRADISPQDAVPPRIDNYPTDVRQATRMQKLRRSDSQLHATLAVAARPEFAQPEFPLERDVQTGKLLEASVAPASVQAMTAKAKIAYTPPTGASLAAVSGKMSLTCHASPDAGWLELSQFLADIQEQLTVGIYDFTSAHILKSVTAGLSGKQRLNLVLDHPALNHSADQSDDQTEADLAKSLGAREQFAWAAEAHDPMVTKAIFPTAYHIKVAVKDHESFWLSSGNWNNSNQPEINPFDNSADPAHIAAIAKKSDRDWHVIMNHAGLAKTFEAFLERDLEVAIPLQADRRAAAALPSAASMPNPEQPIQAPRAPLRYFQPLEIKNEQATVQPLLTPDTGAGNYAANILKLIHSATSKLYIQTQYIHPPKPGADAELQRLIDAVQAKIAAGLDVRIILSEFEATGGWLEKLQEAGLEMSAVRIQQGVHNKGFVVDSRVVALGSQNWSGDGVLRNRDATLIIHHVGAAQYYEGIFTHDWTNLAVQKLLSQVSTSGGRRAGAAAN